MRAWLAAPVSFGVWLLTVLMLGVVFGVGMALAIQSAIDSHDAKTAASRQAEGRAIAIDVLCGFGNGVAEAGRKALAGQLEGQSGRGLPQRAQDDYVATVNSRLLAAAGVRAADVLIRSGSNVGLIDCQRLRVAARATHP